MYEAPRPSPSTVGLPSAIHASDRTRKPSEGVLPGKNVQVFLRRGHCKNFGKDLLGVVLDELDEEHSKRVLADASVLHM